ncbi:hypothetical protein AX16_000749 [Volvariella volvacea WC 439]|nr:hypothetical protein AX16_000749 [Volvariella volvacea WC 439]
MSLPPVDAETIQILSSAPFVKVEGIVNIRDVGGYSVAREPGRRVKSGVVFRSGEPSRITDVGKAQLKNLASTVFDLRSPREIALSPSVLGSVEGITVVTTPIATDESYDPASLQKRLESFSSNEQEAFRALYQEMLEHGGETWGTILRHLRDNPTSPCLVHCTGGKDRTGVLAALLLLLLGVSDEDIIKDYSLTTFGLRPALPFLLVRFQKEPVFKDNLAGTMNMAKSEPETMAALLETIREDYGGVEEYLLKYSNLSLEDFHVIRTNLIE